jgi:hypothetical protein
MDMDSKSILEYANGSYYSYDGELYTRTFPHNWAETHLKNTGPKECKQCGKYGSWNGVFVAYCIDCANRYKENGRNGRGNGVYIYETMQEVCPNTLYSAFNTYLYNVDFDKIGDKCMLDSEQVYKITPLIDDIDKALNILIKNVSYDYNNNIELPHS